jgi:nucleoside-diphosphate-sugar epimerase
LERNAGLTTLVAGGAGFVGSHLCERLLGHGETVICIDNLMTGRLKNVHGFRNHSNFEYIQWDIVESLPELPQIDRIFHLASPASPPMYQRYPVDTLRVNSEGTLRLLNLASTNNARFLYASTSEIYGDPLQHPQREEYRGNVNPVGPRSMYDEAKRFGEALTVAYNSSHQVETRIVRIFNTYGPRMDPEDGRVVSNFIVQALQGEPITIYGDGSQTRSFQYVDDLVDGMIRLMGSAQSLPVNIGNPSEYTVLELASIIRELTGSSSPIEFRPLPQDDPKQRRPDISLAWRSLAWEPRVPVIDGLRRTIAHFHAELTESGRIFNTDFAPNAHRAMAVRSLD